MKMRIGTKKWLITAFILLVVGLLMFAIVMTANGWSLLALQSVKYETNTHEITEEFKSISISTDTSDIVFAPSDDGKVKVVCYENPNDGHTVNVDDGTLKITKLDERKWYEHVGVNFSQTKVTIYLPEAEYGSLTITASTADITDTAKNLKFDSVDITLSTGDVKFFSSAKESLTVKASTGDIRLEGASARTVTLTVTTGDITIKDVMCDGDFSTTSSTGKVHIDNLKCKNLNSKGTTSDITLKDATVENKFSIERTTGDVTLDGCDGGEIVIKTGTGNVVGTLLTGKMFSAKASTGKIDVPESTIGGKCQITTSTGDIKIKINKQ